MSSVLELLGPSTGGIRRHVATLGRLVAESGWSVRFAGPAGVLDGLLDGPDAAPAVASAATPTVVPAVVDVPRSMHPGRVLAACRQVRALGEFDLVHAHGLKAGWVAMLARVGHHRPVVLTIHNVVLDEVAGRAAGIQRRLERLLVGRVDHVIAVSPEIVDHFAGAVRPDRIDVVIPASPAPAPVRDRAEVRAELGAGHDDVLVVVVARLNPQKDLPMFVAAWADVVADHPGARAAIVGEGELRIELERRIADAGVADSLRLYGPSPYAVEQLAAADVVALSSRWEGAPLVVAEAMQLGRPVVSTRVGVVPEMIGEAGTIVEVGDRSGFAAALGRYVADADLRRTAGRVGRERGTVIYGARALADQVAAIYEEVLAR